MKKLHKLLSLLIAVVMALSLTDGFAAKAASAAVTVTLRVEQDGTTLLPPTQVTLTEEDKGNDFGIELLTTGADAVYSPLRALAKYLSTVKGIKNEDMENYIIVENSSYGAYVNGISLAGDGKGSASTAGADSSVSWMYDVNDTLASVGMADYSLSDQDSVVFYGLWYSYTGDETLYTRFDKENYTASLKDGSAALNVTLTGSGQTYDDSWNAIPYTKPIDGATVYVADYTDEGSFASAENAVDQVKTDAEGNAALTFTKEGTYVLSASRLAADGVHYDISRPYATVTVTADSVSSSSKVVTAPTPTDPSKSGALWTRSFLQSGTTSYNSVPIVYGDKIYLVNSDTLYELNAADGQILGSVPLSAKMNSVCNLIQEDHFLYIPLNDGVMECVDINTMKSCWTSDAFGGQSLSTVLYHDGKLYAGSTTVTSGGTTGTFYCLNATDGTTVWTYEDKEHPGGYYWSGAIVYGDSLFFSGDNGILVSHSLSKDEVYDTYTLTDTAKLRSGITYSSENDALYTVSNDGKLYKIQVLGRKVKSCQSDYLVPDADAFTSTSTPTIYNGRIYVGGIANQYGCVAVVDADTLETIYTVQGAKNAEVKSTPLVSVKGDAAGTVTVYFSANALPGGLYYFVDTPDAVKSTCQTLYTPDTAKQYCMSSIVSGSDGTLYYSNDSGTLFAIGTVENSNTTPNGDKSKKITVKKPTKVKIKKSKKKIKLTWKKKTAGSQTVVYVKYGSGKWQKKIVKKATKLTLAKKGKKKLRIKLCSRKKQGKKWYYSAYTKTFLLKF